MAYDHGNMKVYIYFFPFTTDKKVNVRTQILKRVKLVRYICMVYSQASIICVTSFSIIYPLYMVVFHFISYLLPDIRIWDWIDEQLEYKDCHLLQAYFSLGSLYGFLRS